MQRLYKLKHSTSPIGLWNSAPGAPANLSYARLRQLGEYRQLDSGLNAVPFWSDSGGKAAPQLGQLAFPFPRGRSATASAPKMRLYDGIPGDGAGFD
jgi:hypothetical protein